MVRPNQRLWIAQFFLWPMLLSAQTAPDLATILERLDRLDHENQSLSQEVRALRAEIAALKGPADSSVSAAAFQSPAEKVTVEEKLDIQQQRIAEQAQTKVEAAQRFPIRLAGMLLFNAYRNSKQNGGVDYPLVAGDPGPDRGGASLRQSIIGLEFRGPTTAWGGRVHGSIYMDFFGEHDEETMRIRTGSIGIDWKSRKLSLGIEKPIFNPREPSSLAQAGVSPLTGAGNLWLWLPQARAEQDFRFWGGTGLRAQVGVVQTREIGPYGGIKVRPEASRPGFEGRFEFFHSLDDNRRIEIAPGFHTSTTHAAGRSIPSSLVSLDWFFNPWRRIEFTGAFYTGQNVAHLGSGTRQGYEIDGAELDIVKTVGGWGQITLHTTKRLDFHLFTGQTDDRNAGLTAGAIGKNLVYGINAYYHLAPNVLLGLETSQVRTLYIEEGKRINNHYDLSLAYLF